VHVVSLVNQREGAFEKLESCRCLLAPSLD
jgi:hypothetical protein